MKPELNKKYNTIAFYSIVVIAVSTMLITLIMNYRGITQILAKLFGLLTPFIVGFAIAYILNPVLNVIEHKILRRLFGKRIPPRVNRALSLVLSYIFSVFILFVFFSIVIPQITSSVVSIAGQVPGWIVKAQDSINQIIVDYDLKNLQTLNPSIWRQVESTFQKLINTLSVMVTSAIPQIWKTTLSVTTGLFNFVIGIIISIYILLSKERFFAQVKKLLNAVVPTPVVNKLIEITHQSHDIFSGFISGKLLDSCIIGLLCFMGMSFFRIDYAMLISVIVGVTNIIPYFGPFIGAIPSALILLIINPIEALGFAVFVLILQQLDGNIIGPMILGDSTGLSPFWVIFSITVFGSLLGFLGMFIGVPVFAVIYSLIRQFCEWRLKSKNMPTRTAAYASDLHLLLDDKEKKMPKAKHVLFKKK